MGSHKRKKPSVRPSTLHQHHLTHLAQDDDSSSEASSTAHKRKHLHLTSLYQKLEKPAKTIGKVIAWTAPLVLVGLEIRHELHSHGHKRKLMAVELEKNQIDLDNDRDKRRHLTTATAKATATVESIRDKLHGSSGHDGALVLAPRESLAVESTRPAPELRRYHLRRVPARRASMLAQRRSSLTSVYESYYRRSFERGFDNH